jgi:DNA-binding response OmpR family regulator
MPLKILIADDDRVLAQLIAAVVRAEGHLPIHAYDAMQTVMFAMRNPAPDLIVLDINMPGGTGLDVLRKLKMSSKTGLIPVVVVSGSIDQSLPTKVRELGATDFLTKPIDPEALSAAIRSAME